MEKRSAIKKKLIIMMIVLLMIGCGQQRDVASGGVGSSLSGAMIEVGRSAEKAFYAFIELMSDVLGFTVKTTTKKNDVGEYFNNLGNKLGDASVELEQVAKKSEGGEGSKDRSIALATDQGPGAAVGDKAAAILSTVNGEEILASIVISEENDQALGGNNADGSTSTLKFALGGNKDNLAQEAAKAAAVSGGIALRSLVKGGKLAGHSNDDDKVVQSVGVTAVNKLLGAVEDIIKKTVNKTLEKVKQEIDKARAPKAAGQQ